MIVSIYLEYHEYLIEKPQIINLGGEYTYMYEKQDSNLLIKRKRNEKFIENFFNVSNSECKINLLSAIVGQNGVGKSSILNVIRNDLNKSTSQKAHRSTILVEIKNETLVLQSEYENIFIIDIDKKNARKRKIKKAIVNNFGSIYYSPHFDLKYNYLNQEDKYDISLDQFIRQDFTDVNERVTKFELHEELVFKNSMRQVEFLNSSIYQENEIFRDVFKIPHYETGILYFRDVEIPDNFHNTPTELTFIIEDILRKINDETKELNKILNVEGSKIEQQQLRNKNFLQRFILKTFVSVVIQQMEKSNTWLEEGELKILPEANKFKNFSAKDLVIYFIKNSYIQKGSYKQKIFKHENIVLFFDKLDLLINDVNNLYSIQKNSIRLSLNDAKEILELHNKITFDLNHYYPIIDNLLKKEDYISGFVSFKPTDRSMSSGENALLNLYSKLFDFVQKNLTENSKSLPDKKNYVILLDEADLGFHPIWKKRYVEAILKTIPFFFESLKIKPQLQLIITTHDPLTLSDFPVSNVVFLQQNKETAYCSIILNEDENKIQKTFGANITSLLAHSFFINNGLIGDFSHSKIKEVINWININKEKPENMRLKPEFHNELEYFKKIINLIDERIIKIKLTEMITDLVPDDTYYNAVINKEIELLKSKVRK
ncbi:AAA family ATPase [Elizabethkingia ursingii]|uniref:ATPase AAA-type core domain-containing protein n=1 Tax=Elizabethkingia ursingii TaxID=1756150 RepID=A0ABX3N314_9FLAO|nr:AAA family ATPase [Elizabethkingia ursingii]OPB84428.1 hypothetical protein BB021_16940 [Elizabethkingia ursingii]